MKVTVIKGPEFEKRQAQCHEYLYTVIVKKVQADKKVS